MKILLTILAIAGALSMQAQKKGAPIFTHIDMRSPMCEGDSCTDFSVGVDNKNMASLVALQNHCIFSSGQKISDAEGKKLNRLISAIDTNTVKRHIIGDPTPAYSIDIYYTDGNLICIDVPLSGAPKQLEDLCIYLREFMLRLEKLL